MKIFLDDERTTPEGWIRVYTVEECKKAVLTRLVTVLSLDNDLGDLDPQTEGYQVINFIEQLVNEDPTFPIPEMTVHSSNAGRAPSMRQAIKRLENIRQDQISLQESKMIGLAILLGLKLPPGGVEPPYGNSYTRRVKIGK